jgi:Fe-Mn family superoxide dismutase
MPFSVPDLPYAYDALEPHIDEQTMRIHHDKHHAAYVAKVNAALEGHEDLADKSIEDLLAHLDQLPESIRTAVRNNGGGHYNHTLFWEIMAPGDRGSFDDLAPARSAFGSLESLQERFNAAGAGQFGSGWAWVTVAADGKLAIEATPNQDSPIMEGRTPILGCDVWEHAYYLKYQNRRPDYLSAWWNVVNWHEVAKRFRSATA